MNRLMISSIVTLRMTLCNGSGLSFHCLLRRDKPSKIERESGNMIICLPSRAITLLFDDEDDLELVGDMP